MSRKRRNIFVIFSFLISVVGLNFVTGKVNDIGHGKNNGKSRSPVVATDLMVTVKTTAQNHRSRVREILNTWYRTDPGNIFFITDKDDPQLQRELVAAALDVGKGGENDKQHALNSRCASDHSTAALCCKMVSELRLALEQRPKWWCHFDDDNLVNVDALRRLLSRYHEPKRVAHYLGRISTREPIKISLSSSEFWFATGGAGVCLSQAALRRLRAYVTGGHDSLFEHICAEASIPDDVTLGYVMTLILRVPLTQVEQFHSHLEDLARVHATNKEVVSTSFGRR